MTNEQLASRLTTLETLLARLALWLEQQAIYDPQETENSYLEVLRQIQRELGT